MSESFRKTLLVQFLGVAPKLEGHAVSHMPSVLSEVAYEVEAMESMDVKMDWLDNVI